MTDYSIFEGKEQCTLKHIDQIVSDDDSDYDEVMYFSFIVEACLVETFSNSFFRKEVSEVISISIAKAIFHDQ